MKNAFWAYVGLMIFSVGQSRAESSAYDQLRREAGGDVSVVFPTAGVSGGQTAPARAGLLGWFDHNVTVDLPETIARFKTNTGRKISRVELKYECYRKLTLWERINSGMRWTGECDDFDVRIAGGPGEHFSGTGNIMTGKVGEDAFKIPAARFQFSSSRGALLALTIAVKIEGVDEFDGTIFKNQDDYFSLRSFCTEPEVPEYWPNRYLYTQHKLFSAYQETFKAPIFIELTR